MNLISWILVSIATGMLTNVVIPRRLSVGYLGTSGAAVLGGVVFGFGITLAGLAAELHFDLKSVVAAIVGALVGVALVTLWMLRYGREQRR